MKHIKHINELFGIGNLIRSKIYSDEDVANEILNKLNSGTYRKELITDRRAIISKYIMNNTGHPDQIVEKLKYTVCL
jgi:hypothetical protein